MVTRFDMTFTTASLFSFQNQISINIKILKEQKEWCPSSGRGIQNLFVSKRRSKGERGGKGSNWSFQHQKGPSQFLEFLLSPPGVPGSVLCISNPNPISRNRPLPDYSKTRLVRTNTRHPQKVNNIFLFEQTMIPFYNFEMAPNPYNMVCSNLPIVNLVNPIFQPQFFPQQQVICLGYLPQIKGLETGMGSPILANPMSQSIFDKETMSFKESRSSFQFMKEPRTKQINQQSEVSVPKTRAIKKPPKMKYLKKNTESNVSNQVLTFLADQKKSKHFLISICRKQGLDQKDISPKFYEWMEVIKASTKKYISKKILLRLSISSPDHILLKQFSKLSRNLTPDYLSIFCRVIRILMRIFLTQFSHLTILTSKKIHRQGTVEHLVRRRQIKNYLEQKYTKI